jgi:hypothetical protein
VSKASNPPACNAALDTAFSNGKWAINVKTVGQMIDELSRLPRDLEVHTFPSESADLVIFNRNPGEGTPHLGVEDGGGWTDYGGGQ